MRSDMPEAGRIPWWTGLVIFFLLALMLVLSSFAIASLLVALGASPDTVAGLATPVGLGIQVLVVSGIFGAVALVVPKLSEVPVRPWLRLVRVGPAVIALSMLGMVGLGFLVDELTFFLHTASPETFSSDGLDLFNQMFQLASPLVFLLLTLAVTLGPGLGEELLFRGLLLRSFLAGMPPVAALILSSALFGLIHLNLLQGVGAGVIGFYLGFVVLTSGSLWPAVAAHALNNLICALFARFGGDLSSVWTDGHPAWLIAVAAVLVVAAVIGLLKITAKAASSENSTGEPPPDRERPPPTA
jgi:membrane protease YdiL (CAAX protease family)